MKALRALVVAALGAGGLATTADAVSADARSTARPSGATTHHWSANRSTGHSTGRTAGTSSGHRWSGHHQGHWRGSVGFYFGVPLFWPSSYYWGHPYYYDSFYYPRTVIYEVERHPMSHPEGEMAAPPATEVQRGPGAPTQGPLYMNFCESAKAYYPKVTSCPEGWKFLAPS